MNRQRILTISGPSGCGKTYLINKLKEESDKQLNGLFYTPVQYTTRPMRDNEINGVDYNFISEEEYNEIKPKLTVKTFFNGNFYGTAIKDLYKYNDENKIPVFTVNTLGMKDLNEFIENKNIDILRIGLNKIDCWREERNQEIIEKEREVLKLCDIIFNIPQNNFINVLSIIDIAVTYFEYGNLFIKV